MDDFDQVKQQYIDSAIVNSKAASDGDYKTANKHAKIVARIVKKVRDGKIDKRLLVELLDHENIRVRALAAIDLLRINHEVGRAEKTLERVAATDETGKEIYEKLTIMTAGIQLKSWKEKHWVS